MSEVRKLFVTAELDPQDVALQVHADAMKEKETQSAHDRTFEDINFRQINDYIYHLLLKNVSKDDPLTSEEVQYLRSFRSSMSGEQWQRWLSYARAERKRLKESGELYKIRNSNSEDKLYEHSPRSKPLPSTMSLAEAIDASLESNQRSNSFDSQQSTPAIHPQVPTVSDSTRRRSLFHMTSVPVISEVALGGPISPSSNRHSIPSTFGQQPRETPQKVESRIPATAIARKACREHANNKGASSPSRLDVHIPRPQSEDPTLSTPYSHPLLNGTSFRSQSGTPNRYSVLEATPVMVADHAHQTDGFSTMKPTGIRSQSAPRLRPTVPSNLSVAYNLPPTPAVIPVLSTPSSFQREKSPMHRNSSALSCRTVDEMPPRPPQYVNPLWPSQATATNFKSSLKSTIGGPPSSFAVSPGRAIANFVSEQSIHPPMNQKSDTYSDETKDMFLSKQQQKQTSNNDIPASLASSLVLEDLRDALESAQIGSNRIDNACTAARFLINSLNTMSNQVDSSTNQDLERSRNVLEEMLRSLEKSKANFGQIESSVTKNLQVEDLHQPTLSSIANVAASASIKSFPNRQTQVNYHPHGTQHSEPQPTVSNDSEGMQYYPSDDYLRFQPLADDMQSMHSQSVGNSMGINRQLGGSHSTILRRSAMSQQQQQYYSQNFDVQCAHYLDPTHDEGVDNNQDDYSMSGRSIKSAQKMWSPAKSFRGGQRVLAEEFSSTDGKNQAQNTWGLVTRVCINRGSLVKAYEDFPIRLDLEAMSMDIVWRESRVDLIRGSNIAGFTMNTSTSSSSSTTRGSRASADRHMRPTVASSAATNAQGLYDMESQRILRRERFQFDAMYIGPAADRKLQEYVRFRTRVAMENGTNLVFLCNACGESMTGELEAPVTLTLGSGGGSGIATNILQEAFNYVHAHNQHLYNTDPNGVNANDKLRSSTQNQYLTTKMVQENRLSSISMTAVLINGNTIVDMLSNASSSSHLYTTGRNGQAKSSSAPNIHRRSSQKKQFQQQQIYHGEVTLSGVTTLDLSNAMDFERIVGLLLGRRTGINEAMQSFHRHNVNGKELINENVPLSSYATWTTPSLNPATERLRRFDPGMTQQSHSFSSTTTSVNNNNNHNGFDDQQYDLPSSSSTMMLSFRIALGSSLFPKRVVHIRVICPCGKDWSLPNFDLSVLAESIGALPHSPPEGLLAVSPLTMLLTDLSQQPSNFVSVVNVNRVDAKKRHMRVAQSEQDIALTALNSMRVSCLAR